VRRTIDLWSAGRVRPVNTVDRHTARQPEEVQVDKAFTAGGSQATTMGVLPRDT